MENLVFGVLGCGKLGSLIVERLIAIGVDPSRIRIVRRKGNRVIGLVDVLFVAVKPHQFEEAWSDLTIDGDPIIISCMAKVSLETIARVTGSQRIARLMTTTACVIGKGIGNWMPGQELDPMGCERVPTITAQLGLHIEATHESEFVLSTALSSMNGLIFLLVQYLEEAMVFIGAPARYTALVVPLIESAMAYRRHRSSVNLVALADEVTSPGGTTSRLRLVVHRGRLAATLIDAIVAAAERAKG
ncbi:MAG: pyrroline-5-carboxylate reductase dimerization domain-containing protein [Patescibacteria group bacterium]